HRTALKRRSMFPRAYPCKIPEFLKLRTRPFPQQSAVSAPALSSRQHAHSYSDYRTGQDPASDPSSAAIQKHPLTKLLWYGIQNRFFSLKKRQMECINHVREHCREFSCPEGQLGR